VYSLRICAHWWLCKYCNQKSVNLGKRLHHWLKIAQCRGLPRLVLCYMKTVAEPASDTLCFSNSFRWRTKYKKQRLSVIHHHWSPTELNFYFIFCFPKKLRKWNLKYLLITNISITTYITCRPIRKFFILVMATLLSTVILYMWAVLVWQWQNRLCLSKTCLKWQRRSKVPPNARCVPSHDFSTQKVCLDSGVYLSLSNKKCKLPLALWI
jgi:hypothetical protein